MGLGITGVVRFTLGDPLPHKKHIPPHPQLWICPSCSFLPRHPHLGSNWVTGGAGTFLGVFSAFCSIFFHPGCFFGCHNLVQRVTREVLLLQRILITSRGEFPAPLKSETKLQLTTREAGFHRHGLFFFNACSDLGLMCPLKAALPWASSYTSCFRVFLYLFISGSSLLPPLPQPSTSTLETFSP